MASHATVSCGEQTEDRVEGKSAGDRGIGVESMKQATLRPSTANLALDFVYKAVNRYSLKPSTSKYPKFTAESARRVETPAAKRLFFTTLLRRTADVCVGPLWGKNII